MITREEYNKALDIVETYHEEEYNKALDIVNTYHEQLRISAKTISVKVIKKIPHTVSTSKTLIFDWLKFRKCNGRLKNILENFPSQDINYIEDITKEDFVKTQGAGKKTWKEFERIRGVN